MAATGGTGAFVRITIEEHRVALMAETPIILASAAGELLNSSAAVFDFERPPNGGMATSTRTATFVRISIEKQLMTFAAEPPIALYTGLRMRWTRYPKQGRRYYDSEHAFTNNKYISS
jgi:hypothetical protein